MSLFQEQAVCEEVKFFSHHIKPSKPQADGLFSISNGAGQYYELRNVNADLTGSGMDNHLKLSAYDASGTEIPAMVVAPNGDFEFAGNLHILGNLQVDGSGGSGPSASGVSALQDASGNQATGNVLVRGTGGITVSASVPTEEELALGIASILQIDGSGGSAPAPSGTTVYTLPTQQIDCSGTPVGSAQNSAVFNLSALWKASSQTSFPDTIVLPININAPTSGSDTHQVDIQFRWEDNLNSSPFFPSGSTLGQNIKLVCPISYNNAENATGQVACRILFADLVGAGTATYFIRSSDDGTTAGTLGNWAAVANPRSITLDCNFHQTSYHSGVGVINQKVASGSILAVGTMGAANLNPIVAYTGATAVVYLLP